MNFKNLLSYFFTFKPYVRKQSHGLSACKCIETEIPAKVLKIFEVLKANDKFKNDAYIFNKLVVDVENHNKIVEEIQNFKNSFSYELFLKNINNVTDISSHLDILNKLSTFSTLGDYSALYDELKDICNNFSEILSQKGISEELETILTFEDCYIDSKTKNKILTKCNEMIKKLEHKKLYYDFGLLELEKLKSTIDIQNKNFVNSHIDDEIFDNILGRSLDFEQRQSVLKDDISNLTIAGAGSGKTLTICGKIKYLLSLGVSPEEILLLSYSRKSAEDLETKTKLIDPNFKVGTFHKIGLEIIKNNTQKSLMVEEQFNAIIEEFFRTEMVKNPSIMNKILKYYGLYLTSYNDDKKYSCEGEMYNDLKTLEFHTLKDSLISMGNGLDSKETIKKEYVKSYEELAIANFYFLNGVEYRYEAPYKVDVATYEKRQYMPDFYLDEYGIYHEHYGIDREGKASQYDASRAQEYIEGIQWKRNIHEEYGTKCLETYSYQFEDGSIFEILEEQLKKAGVELNPLSDKEIYDAINSIYEGQNFKSFINLIKTFIGLYKARYKTDKTFDDLKLSKFKNVHSKNRAILFLDICKEIYNYYINYLRKEGKIDFDDMILQSVSLIDETDLFRYKYIIVDEFQDISYSRMEFLKKLISHGKAKLFAVGDDWQAIYRFSGCDIFIFLDFENFFGESNFNSITTTHRNSQELQDIVGPFIRKNPQQINKTIKSDKHLKNPIKVIYYENDKYGAFLSALEKISNIDDKANVLVIGRNNKDIDSILSGHLYFKKAFNEESTNELICDQYKNLHLKFTTAHSAKGLEEDFVILINAEDSRLGFPNKIEDDPLLNLVLGCPNEMEFAEERRLWYVSLTRTKNYTFIIANYQRPSAFLNEIIGKCEIIKTDVSTANSYLVNCPYCKTGHLIKRQGLNGRMFYGCSNFPYCRYSIDDFSAVTRNKRCPICGDFLVVRNGKYGPFISCHGYPRCNFKKNIKD